MGWVSDNIIDPITGKSAEKAADVQAQALREGQDQQLDMFYQARDDLAPWRSTGIDALNVTRQMLGLSPLQYEDEDGNLVTGKEIDPLQDLAETPGYQFQMDQGLKALERQLGETGASGAAMKAVSEFSQNLANQTFGQRLQQLASLAGSGQSAAAQQSNQAMNMGGSLANTAASIGQTQAGGIMGQANAMNNLISQGAMLAGAAAGGGGGATIGGGGNFNLPQNQDYFRIAEQPYQAGGYNLGF